MKTLENKKVFLSTPEISKSVQEKIFKLGCTWCIGINEVKNTHAPFLFIDGKSISFSTNIETFRNSKCEEITAAEILAMDIPEPEETFEVFQKVLVRDADRYDWIPDFFRSKGGGDYPYVTISGIAYQYCIDYETNKHLAFTNEKPGF